MFSQKLPSSPKFDAPCGPCPCTRLAVRRHAHDLVLAVVDLEAEPGGEGRVEQAERVREARLPGTARCCSLPVPSQVALPTPSVAEVHSPTPSTVRTADSSYGEQKNALAACDRWCSTNSTRSCGTVKLAADHVLDPELLVQPGDHRLAEDGQRVRPGRTGRRQQPLELRQRLLVEDDVVEILGA